MIHNRCIPSSTKNVNFDFYLVIRCQNGVSMGKANSTVIGPMFGIILVFIDCVGRRHHEKAILVWYLVSLKANFLGIWLQI